MNGDRIELVCLKAFGDLVMARWALRRMDISASSTAGLLFGSHLVELNAALGELPGAQVIEHGEVGVPAFFDVRKRGIVRALGSGLGLRSAIRQLRLPATSTLLFDRLGSRERFLTRGLRHAALTPGSQNIYLAYEEAFRPFGPAPVPSHPHRTGAPYVGIFPGSRIASKRLPAAIIQVLAAVCSEVGVECRIFLLEGEATDLDGSEANVVHVPRNFAAMTTAAHRAYAVISADSMPAHLAEYFGVPVFVVSSVTNPFWLPKSCYERRLWTLFSEVSNSTNLLRQFITSH